MIKYKKNKIYFFLAIIILSGCSQKQVFSSSFSSGMSFLFNLTGGDETTITRDLIEKIPYASSVVSFGNSQSLLILESIDKETKKWISADKIYFFEEDGRILGTIGLPNDVFVIERPKLSFVELLNGKTQNYFAYYSFKQPDFNNLLVEIKFEAIGTESVNIFGIEKELLLVEEHLLSSKINWKVKNKYWIDPEDYFVWKSEQNLSPRLPKVEFTVTKKPSI